MDIRNREAVATMNDDAGALVRFMNWKMYLTLDPLFSYAHSRSKLKCI
jgi:hypothetical protein